MSGVELRGVEKSFGPVHALRDVDLCVPPAIVTAVLGPSGCGKTTTLRIIAGLDAPDRGQVLIGGDVVSGPDQWTPPERRRVGMLFQHLALFPHLDVAGNVAYGLRRMDRDARRGRVSELLELVGLSGYERRYPDQLSGGQAQRVALARAMAPRPAVMLLDEPFASLDVSLRAEVRTEVNRILRDEAITTVLVTHDQEEALSLGDQVIVMLDGRVAQAGSPEHVYRHPASPAVATFLGEPNLVAGQVRSNLMSTELGTILVDAPDGAALAVVHPEDVDLHEDDSGPARVVAVQYYGHDQVVTVGMPSGARLRARLSSRRRLPAGAPVAVEVRAGEVGAFPTGPPSDGPVEAVELSDKAT